MGAIFDLVSPRELAFMRHRAYVFLLAAGAASLFSFLAADLQATLVPYMPTAVPVVSNPAWNLAPLTKGTHLDGFSAWSPDGQRIAFMRDGAIWIMNADSSGQEMLLQADGVWNTTPSWSPDGQQLAFVQVHTDTGNGSIMLADGKGKEPRLIWSAKAPVGYLIWTPDGKHLLFSSPRTITQLEISGGNAREIYTAREGWDLTAGGIAVTPDGTQLIFGAGQRVNQGTPYDLYAMPMPKAGESAAATPTPLTETGGIMPAVSPSGTTIAFRNPRRPSGIYLMDVQTQKIRRLLPDGQDEMFFHPAFSPDGKVLSVSRLSLASGREDGKSARMISNLYIFRLDKGD